MTQQRRSRNKSACGLMLQWKGWSGKTRWNPYTRAFVEAHYNKTCLGEFLKKANCLKAFFCSEPGGVSRSHYPPEICVCQTGHANGHQIELCIRRNHQSFSSSSSVRSVFHSIALTSLYALQVTSIAAEYLASGEAGEVKLSLQVRKLALLALLSIYWNHLGVYLKALLACGCIWYSTPL